MLGGRILGGEYVGRRQLEYIELDCTSISHASRTCSNSCYNILGLTLAFVSSNSNYTSNVPFYAA
jgi:hypothetical protein